MTLTSDCLPSLTLCQPEHQPPAPTLKLISHSLVLASENTGFEEECSLD